jgi:hypothetical protein
MRQVLVVGLAASLLMGATASGQVKLERKYIPGSTSKTQLESTTKQILTIGPQDLETESTRFLISTTTVGTRQEDGTLPVVTQFDKLQANMTFPGGIQLSFDSDDPGKKADNAQLEPVLDLFRVVAKTKTTTTLDKANQIKSIAFEGNPQDTVGEAFKSQFDAEKRKQAAIRELSTIPSRPVKPGDSWTHKSEADLGGGQTLTLDTKYEYVGTESKDGKTLDKITTKTTDVSYAMDPNAASPLKVTGSDLKVALSEGSLLFDRERGAITAANSKIRINGTLTMTINGMELPGKLDLTIESKTTLQP